MRLKTPDKLRRLQEALYAKAKREPGCRFYLLYDKIWRQDVLEHAYALCRSNGGAPGVDGQTFADVEAYGRERWLDELREEVKTERYRPEAVRRVMIPKPGGVGERPLGIPTVRDRVVQTAAKLILEPIFEADFDDAAYGYRPGRGALDAVAKVHRALDARQTEVVDADLTQYFDQIPHAALMRCVARRVSDGKVLRLVKAWLKAPIEERDARGGRRRTGGKKATRGTPQGGVASPLLANVYMHRFIKAFRAHGLDVKHRAELVVYADDFVILCSHGAQKVLEVVRRWMAQIGLALNEAKTGVRDARREHFDFLGYTFGPLYSPRTGGRYNGARPSKKALCRVKGAVRARLRPGNLAPVGEVVAALNRTLRGWASYFGYGAVSQVRHDLDAYVEDRVRAFLRRRHKVASRGRRQFPREKIFGELGVLSMRQRPRWSANASA
jgi:RNA-directed DNA polymerase